MTGPSDDNHRCMCTQCTCLRDKYNSPRLDGQPSYSAVALNIRTSVVGLSWASVWTFPNLLMTPMPEDTRPKMVCLPSSHGVGARVTKNCNRSQYVISFNMLNSIAGAQQQLHVGNSNTSPDGEHPTDEQLCKRTWLPFVLAPALAILRMPAPV